MGAILNILSGHASGDSYGVIPHLDGAFDVIGVKTNAAAIYDRVHEAGMVLQDLIDDRHEWYLDRSVMDPVVIAWQPYDTGLLPQALRLSPLRGDELVVPTLDSRQSISWMMGHPRAVLLWSLTVRNLRRFGDVWPADAVRNLNSPEKNITFSDESKMVWWAQRLNLRVYGLP